MRMVADLILLLGATFTLLGALGLVRMPDVYNRIQAGTKAVTLGALSLLLGIGLLYPDWWSKLLVIALMILVTNPIGSSTIARALLMAGVKPWKSVETTTSEQDRA
ncbi:MAG: Na+/H+ antiporter subunit G [gamma proteobacterium symbiont of Ctena orbiculata]|uniref:monovalent cation/H(+) antiporter subunit G n=1 Tax=Candidatus Thiodiazotropha sp. CDECU1 TaxID=3065865 RepID=UPI000D584FFF|nr:monovalent cation/H(+) antiporter subunit G [Candidatus Thiodiazotropha sp. CDECU1]PVV06068.1 MAG: Na+/H+ antiporter subunit G [gamma proteobacterium symbiont of Ctena orbiculata]